MDTEELSECHLDIDKVKAGVELRTTLRVANIPNKYSQRKLLSLFQTHHKGKYDFFYLPVDFKKVGNLGYCFINMLSPEHIAPFYEEFNNRKWDLINSQKVCVIAFARLQGIKALLKRFRDSPVAKEDPRMQPMIIDPISGGCASLAQIHAATKSAVTIGGMQEAALAVAAAAAASEVAKTAEESARAGTITVPLTADSLAAHDQVASSLRRRPGVGGCQQRGARATSGWWRRGAPPPTVGGSGRRTRADPQEEDENGPTSQVRATAAAQQAANEQALAVAAAATLYAEQASSSDAKIDDATTSQAAAIAAAVAYGATQLKYGRRSKHTRVPSAPAACGPFPHAATSSEGLSASRVASAGDSDAPRIDETHAEQGGTFNHDD